MQKKDEMGFIRTLLILFIIFYVVRLFTRYILPALFYNYMNDKMKEFSNKQQKQRQRQQQKAKQHEGEVTIDFSQQDKNKNKPSKGDYVDYVEVKD